MRHLIDIVSAYASAHDAQAVTDYAALTEAQRFTDECLDGRFAVINGVLFDLTQYDDRYVVMFAFCENGFDATADLSEALTADAFGHAVVLHDESLANDLFIELIKAQL